MSEYVSEVTGVLVETYSSRGSESAEAQSRGGIVVRPPIEVGESFSEAILGSRPRGIEIREVAHTTDASIFVAEVHLGHAETQATNIDKIAERISKLANNPESVHDLMGETPFE